MSSYERSVSFYLLLTHKILTLDVLNLGLSTERCGFVWWPLSGSSFPFSGNFFLCRWGRGKSPHVPKLRRRISGWGVGCRGWLPAPWLGLRFNYKRWGHCSYNVMKFTIKGWSKYFRRPEIVPHERVTTRTSSKMSKDVLLQTLHQRISHGKNLGLPHWRWPWLDWPWWWMAWPTRNIEEKREQKSISHCHIPWTHTLRFPSYYFLQICNPSPS